MKDETQLNPLSVKKDAVTPPSLIEEVSVVRPVELEEEGSKLEFLELPVAHNPPAGLKYQHCLERFEWENSSGASRRIREIESALPSKNHHFQAKHKSVAWSLSQSQEFPDLTPAQKPSEDKYSEGDFSNQSIQANSDSSSKDEASSLVFLELPEAHEPPEGMTKEELIEWTKWNTPLLAGSLAKQKEAQAALTAKEHSEETIAFDKVVEELNNLPLEDASPIEMEKQLEGLFQKFNHEAGNNSLARHDRLMIYLCQIVILLARLSGRHERENILDLNDKLQENIIQQKETYATFWPTALKITGFIISAGAAAMGVTPLGGQEIFGQATKKLAEASQAVTGFGNGVNSISDLFEQYQIRDRTLFSFEGKHAETLRGERDRGTNQADQNKAEALRAMQAVVSSLHEIANKLLQ